MNVQKKITPFVRSKWFLRGVCVIIGVSALIVGWVVFQPLKQGKVLGIVAGTPGSTWIPGGSQVIGNVGTLAVAADGTQYLGGSFTSMGPNSGGNGVPISTTTGNPVATFPVVDNSVWAVVSDGSSGWYIGGDFRQVGGVARNYIAHINADGTVDGTWNPNANGSVWALLLDGTTLYVGGSFTSIGGQTRNRIAALSTSSTGDASAWNPNADGTVYALALTGTTLYVGGEFVSSIGTVERHYIAALSTSTGVATAWNPDLDATVYALLISGTTLYVGGEFTTLDSSNTGLPIRNSLASFNTSTGDVTTWDPDAASGVYALARYNTTLYVGGNFVCFNACETTRNRIAAFDTSTGNLTVWDPDTNTTGDVYTLSVSSDGATVYAGGNFTTIGGATRISIAALNASDGLATAWNPKVASYIWASALSGTTLYIAGPFATTGSSMVVRQKSAAIDPSTGQAKSTFNVSTNGNILAFALTADDTSIYMGGTYTTIGGQARTTLAKITTSNGAVDAWTANNNGVSQIHDMILSGTTLYIAGVSAVTSINTLTNNTVNWTSALNAINSDVDSIALVGTTLYVGGQFSTIGGSSRSNIAALDTTNGAVLAWNPGAASRVRKILPSGDGTILYVGGSFTTIASTARNRLASFTVATGAITSWDPNANSPVYSLALSSTHLYVGGMFTSIGGSTRKRLAAFDIADMSLALWDPALNTADTTTNNFNVSHLISRGTSLYAAGTFTTIGTTVLPYYAVFTEAESNPTIQYTATSSSGSEATTSVNIQLELSVARGSGDATVSYAVTGGTATGSGTDYTLASGTATITATNTTTNIPITIVNDSIDETNETIIVTISSPSNATLGSNTAHTYTITDNDTAGVTMTESGGSVNITEGSTTDTYTLVLATQPTANVVIAIAPDSQSTVSAASVTFTTANWDTPQTITVTSVNDNIAEGNHTSTISHTATSSDANYNGISITAATADITDNDTAGVSLSESNGASSAQEGETDSYTIVLTTQPTANVQIAIYASSSSDLSASPASLTFTTANWSTAQTVTISAVDDASIEETETVLVSHTATSSDSNYNGISISSVSVSIVDNDFSSAAPAYSAPLSQRIEGYSLIINNEQNVTFSPIVRLTVQNAGPDVQRIAFSNDQSFSLSSQIPYSPPFSWDICNMEKQCTAGEKNVYARLYGAGGVATKMFSASIQYTPGVTNPNNAIDSTKKNAPKTAEATTVGPQDVEKFFRSNISSQPEKWVKEIPAPSIVVLKPARLGSSGLGVKELQKFLNSQGFLVAKKGAGSPGKESAYFGSLTRNALIRFQNEYFAEILAPRGLRIGTGILDKVTIQVINSMR